jgi:alanine transaminase
MYLFPKITLPPKAIEIAKQNGQEPDEFYAMALLESTGVVVVPGSGFGQQDGTLHFRSTFLPPEDQMNTFIDSIKTFHQSFLEKYSDDSKGQIRDERQAQ